MRIHPTLAGFAMGLAGWAVAAIPVAAQSDQNVLRGDALRACLCLEQAINAAQSDMAQKTGVFETAEAQLAVVDQEIAARRASMNVSDPTQVTAFRALIDHRIALKSTLDQQIYPADLSAVDRYDRLVFLHHQQCDGRTRYAPDVAAVTSAGLACPIQP